MLLDLGLDKQLQIIFKVFPFEEFISALNEQPDFYYWFPKELFYDKLVHYLIKLGENQQVLDLIQLRFQYEFTEFFEDWE